MGKPGNTTKEDMIARLADFNGGTKVAAREFIEDFLEVMADSLAHGDRIVFRDFGVFETKEVPAKACVHPATKERTMARAYKKIKFTAGKRLIEDVRDTEGFVKAPEFALE
jgi:DNA-binding protein HU-beta